MEETVYLIGARAAGKTTVGKALAQALSYRFVDTDLYLLETTGRTVAEMVTAEGWESFRRQEQTALRTVSAPRTVVATGGGMVLSAANRIFMREHGLVCYLYAPAFVLSERLARAPEATQRPSLTGEAIADEVATVLAFRDPLYRTTAHCILNASAPLQDVIEQAVAAKKPPAVD
ncbi:MAG: shikimate kinase AroL [Bilophila sp.]